MPENLDFTTAVRLRVFACPSCKKTINTTVERCPFCSSPIDRSTAETAADAMAEVNLACSRANDIKSFLDPRDALPGSGLNFLIFGPLGRFYLWLYRHAIAGPIMSIRWWLKFRKVRSDIPDFVQAKRDVKRIARISAVIWGVFAILITIAILTGT